MSGAPATATATRAGHAFTLGELAHVLGARLDARPVAAGTAAATAADSTSAAAALRAQAYAIDSRAAAAGVVFFALKGERTDGHAFLADIARAGALAAVVREDAEVPDGLVALRVADTASALGALGRHFRDAWPLTVVGITGSAGKTTTKEFAASLLAQHFRVLKSEGNLNTTLGLPLTLSRRSPEDELAVLELGMSYPGELRRVAAIASPDGAVVTNVGLAHVEHFASADEVAKAKAEILEQVRPGGWFAVNVDDQRVAAMAATFKGRTLTYGIESPADLRATKVEPLGALGTRFEVTHGPRSAEAMLSVVGPHHVRNALAALTVGLALGLDPLELAAHVPALAAGEHRGLLLRLAGDVLLVDDCYNSSPAALSSALTALGTLPGHRRIAILGDMRELGGYSEVAHREAGRRAALHADVVLGVGPESQALVEEAHATGCREVHHVPDAETAAATATSLVKDGDAVLVKASRSMGLEAVVDALKKARG